MVEIPNERRWTIVGLLFLAALINYLDRATLSVALPAISTDLGLSPNTKGVLLSAFFWSYALMQVPIGWCADRFDLRWLYTATFALWSVACGLTGLAGSLAALIALRVVLGMGESIYLPGGSKAVSLLFPPKERGFPAGLFDSGTRAGMALGAPLTAWLIVRYGWRNMFLVVGFSALVWLIPWLTAVSRSPLKAAPTAEITGGSRKQIRIVTFNRDLAGLCLGFFCFGYYWYLLVTWLPDYLVTVRHFTLLKAGLYASLPYFVFGLSQLLGGWLGDRLAGRGWNETRARKGIVTFAFLTGLLLIPAARVESPTLAIALFSAASLVGLSTANILVILQGCAPPDEVGAWTGMENFAGNLGGVLAPMATGLLITRTHSYFQGFALAAAVLVAGLLAYWFVVGELRSQPQPHT